MIRNFVIALAIVASLGGVARADGMVFPIVAEGDRVTVRAEAGLERQAYKLAPRAERHLEDIEADLEGLPRVEHVEVRLVKHMEDVAAAAPPGRGAPAWAAGTAYPEEGIVVVAARSRDGGLLDMEQTLTHELAHMSLERALGGDNVPRWLTEGFAYIHSSDFSWGRAQTLFGAVLRRKIIPLAALDQSFPAREDQVTLAYAQSYDFVSYLARRGRWQDGDDDGDRDAFRRFLASLATNASLDAAAMDAYGRTLSQLEGEWYDTLRTRYLWYPASALGALAWVMAALLLVLGWLRRTRQKRRRLKEMEIEEAVHEAAAARLAAQDQLLH